jgi:hypothetical protein
LVPPCEKGEEDSANDDEKERRKARQVLERTNSTYLITFHFEFPNDLNGDLVILAGGVLGPVDVAVSAIAHLVQQDPAFQAGIFGHLEAYTLFFGDNLLDLELAGSPGLTLGRLGRGLSRRIVYFGINGI